MEAGGILLIATLKWDYDMYVAVRTIDDEKGDAKAFWQKGHVAWHTDYSGFVLSAPPPPGGPPPARLIYSPSSSGPGASAIWASTPTFSTGAGIDGTAFNAPPGDFGSTAIDKNADVSKWLPGM
jgi:hypothetical protein